jgi:hypothetical protein
VVPDEKLQAYKATIIAHLTHITRRWHELGQPCLLEIIHLTPTEKAEVRDVAHFRPDAQGIEDAASHVVVMNGHKLNSYATVNPIDADNRPQTGKRASAGHIVASFFHWADADDATAAANIKNFSEAQCTFYVLTGTVPSFRPHVYFELEEPTRNLVAWKATQEAIASTLVTDGSVVDPPRMMRLAGTVNWPKPSKVAKGYIPEVTSLKIYSHEDRPLFTSERMARIFNVGTHRPRQEHRQETQDGGFNFDTGREDKGGKFAQYLKDCSTDGKKHGGVRGVTAMLGMRMVEPEIVGALIRHVCPVWDENVENLINTAYKFASEPGEADVRPTDLWGLFDPPTLPRGLLPKIIEDFALTQGEIMGADAGGLAAAALCVSCAAIPDQVKLKVKRHDDWSESARIWVALVGDPSTKKSPVLSAAEKPLRKIDTAMFRRYIAAKAAYDALKKEEKADAEKPIQKRKRLEDTTIEAAQEVMGDSPEGLLVLQDELSGWFGGMDRYSNGKGKDRSFWLQAFNGGVYAYNRIGRGAGMVENLSACVLGGIQPEPIRKVVADATDDGLIQRLFPIVLRPAVLGNEDQPESDSAAAYAALIEALTKCEVAKGKTSGFDTGDRPRLIFDDAAQAVRRKMEEKHLGLMAVETLNRKLAAHIGKYDGLFARLCVAFHCIDHGGGMVPQIITEAVAVRAARFLHEFLLPHAVAFYGGILGLSDDHDRLTAVAGHILTHGLEVVSTRDVARGDRTMRGLTRAETLRIFEQLEALGWVAAMPTAARSNAAPTWAVNPEVHKAFHARRMTEAARRKAAQDAVAEAAKAGRDA